MTHLPLLLARIYALLLRLYPRDFRDEFEGEMKTVFADAVEEAARAGPLALVRVCWRELWDLPIHSARERWTRLQKGSFTMSTPTPTQVRPLSWPEILIGLFPFLLFGPVAVWLAYPFPYPPDSVSGWFVRVEPPLYLLCLLFGLVAGWITGWRRWTFPYLGFGIYLVGGWIMSTVNDLLWSYASGFHGELGWPQVILFQVAGFALILGAFALVLLVAYFLTRVVHRLRMLYVIIRHDWTRLSFGLTIGAVIAMSGSDHEEDPVLTALVILPSLILLFSALSYLRSTSRSGQVWSLLLGLGLAVSVSILRHGWYIVYAMMLLPIIFLPALFALRPPQNKPMLAE